MTQLIDYKKVDDHIGLITLNRPEAANAMSKSLLADLAKAVHDIENDPTVYSVVVTGSGEKAFCAGADLKERTTAHEHRRKASPAAISPPRPGADGSADGGSFFPSSCGGSGVAAENYSC